MKILTDHDLDIMRKDMLEILDSLMDTQKHTVTCDTCLVRHECMLAYGLYNIDGDCLADK